MQAQTEFNLYMDVYLCGNEKTWGRVVHAHMMNS